MTNQSVVVSDCTSGINVVAMTVALANSSRFSPVAAALSKPSFGGSGGGYITISRNNSLKNIEINNGERVKRVHAWVESMRASSPTRKSSFSQTADDHKSWIVSLLSPSSLCKSTNTSYILIILRHQLMNLGNAASTSFSPGDVRGDYSSIEREADCRIS